MLITFIYDCLNALQYCSMYNIKDMAFNPRTIFVKHKNNKTKFINCPLLFFADPQAKVFKNYFHPDIFEMEDSDNQLNDTKHIFSIGICLLEIGLMKSVGFLYDLDFHLFNREKFETTKQEFRQKYSDF